MARISPLGHDWATILAKLKSCTNAVKRLDEWKEFDGLYTLLGAPVEEIPLSSRFNRKTTRSMDRVSLLAASATEQAMPA